MEQQQAVRNQIAQEMARLDAARVASLNALPKGSYAHWVAPLLQLLYDMPLSIQQYRERLPAHQAHFRRLDFSHPNFSTSGLWRPLIEGHYLLLENSGRQLEDVFVEMNRSSQLLLDQLQDQPQRFQSTAEFLFRLFERRSLFTSSAFLSGYLLEDKSRTALLSPKFQTRLQKYGLLAVGQPAPDIKLDSRYKLSDLKRNVLLVFGQSDCGSCAQQLPELQKYYPQWKEKLEVVYLSLDTDAEAFKSFYGNSPFKVYCDFQGWESRTVQQYFVNGPPTYLLLDSELKVLEHIVSLAQVDNWVKFKL